MYTQLIILFQQLEQTHAQYYLFGFLTLEK